MGRHKGEQFTPELIWLHRVKIDWGDLRFLVVGMQNLFASFSDGLARLAKENLMRRLITIAVALLTMASSALAQDTFNVNTNPPANTNPSDAATCQSTYSAAMEKLREQDLEAQGELQKDVVNCNQDQGCRIAAEKRYEAAHNEVLKGEVDADANRDICSHHANLSSTLAVDAQNHDPCHSQYDQTMSGLADEETLAQAQSQKDEIDCQPVNDNGSCRIAASQKFEAAHNKVLNGETDADTKRAICSNRQALAQSETSSPSNPGGPQTPEVAPSPSAGLAGGVTKNAPATGPAASNSNHPASASSAANENNPAPPEKPVGGIAQVPKLAPTTGPASASSPRKPLLAGISKYVPGTTPKPISQPPPPNNIAKNQPAGTTSGLGAAGKAIANPNQVGSGGASGQVPGGRPTVHGPLRIVREGADWVAKHFPGGEAGAQAAADYSKQLKQPFEDRWTKQPDGGIREVGETLAGHGIGKVAGKLLGAAASKIAESPIGRAILDRFPKFPKLMGGVAKDAEESESAANRAAQNPPSRNPGPPQRSQGQAPEQARKGGNGPGSSGNGNSAADQQRMRQAQKQGQSPPQEQARNRPPSAGGPNNSPNRAPQQRPPQRPAQNNQPQEQARNPPSNSSGPNNSANNRAPQQRQPPPPGQNSPQQQARNDPRLQSGAGGIGGKSEEGFIPPRPTIKPTVVSDGFGGYKATWGSDPKAFAMFRPEKDGVVVSDLFRGAQPSGSGGIMLADALRKGGLQRPASITFSNIIEDRTLAELKAGMAPGETLLGKTLGNASKDLGARVVGWATGVTNGKPWMKGVLAYE